MGSNRAGAARELGAALLVNPYDARAVADALHAALAMPVGERRARHEQLLAALAQHDIHAWQRRFIESLETLPTLIGSSSGSDLSVA